LRVFVKICGCTSQHDAELAVAAGADAVGFILAPSPRQVTPAFVAEVVAALPPETVTIGVFRDEAPERVVEAVRACRLTGAQLHGGESPATTRYVRERIGLVIKAFDAEDAALERAAEHRADVLLLEGAQPGSGKVFDWALCERVPPGARVLLAGGLRPSNVAEAIATVRPWGVDAATGVESEPGRKDPGKVRAFVAAARLAAPPGWRAAGRKPFDWEDVLADPDPASDGGPMASKGPVGDGGPMGDRGRMGGRGLAGDGAGGQGLR